MTEDDLYLGAQPPSGEQPLVPLNTTPLTLPEPAPAPVSSFDQFNADLALKRQNLASTPLQQRVIDLSGAWTRDIAPQRQKTFAEFAGDKYDALDSTAKQNVWDNYVKSELTKGLPAGYTPAQLEAAKAAFSEAVPRPQSTGPLDYLISGAKSTGESLSTVFSSKSAPSLARAVRSNVENQIQDPEMIALNKRIDQRVKEAGGSTFWNELSTRTAEYGSNPRLFGKLALQQLSNSIPALAGAIAGGKAGAAAGAGAGTFVLPGVGTVGGGVVGGALGAVVGGFLGGVAPEYGGDLLQRIQTEATAAGVDVRNKDALEAFIQERGVDHFTDPALRKGIGTAATDSLFNAVVVGRLGSVAKSQAKVIAKTEADLAKGVITAEQAASNLAKAQGRVAAAQRPLAKATSVAGTAGVEALGEGVSEAAGRFYADNKIDWGDVADEMLFGTAHGTAFGVGGKVWNAATGAANEYDTAVSKLQQRLNPPQQQTETSVPDTSTIDTTGVQSTAEAPIAAPTPPVAPPQAEVQYDELTLAAIDNLRAKVPDFSDRLGADGVAVENLSVDELSRYQMALESLPPEQQRAVTNLIFRSDSNGTETNTTAGRQPDNAGAQEAATTTSAEGDTANGTSTVPPDGGASVAGATDDGIPAGANLFNTGTTTGEVDGRPVTGSVDTSTPEGAGSGGAAEPGAPSLEVAPQEPVAMQGVTERTLDTLRQRAEEVVANLSTEDTIALRDYLDSVEIDPTTDRAQIRTQVRQELGRFERLIEEGRAAERAGITAADSPEVRAISDAIKGGVVFADSNPLRTNIKVDEVTRTALRNDRLNAALTALSISGSSPLARAVASRLREVGLNNVRVSVAPVNNVDESKLNGLPAAGSFDPTNNLITLDPNFGLNERVVLHETAHAATLEAIDNPNTPEKRQAVREMTNIYNQAKRRMTDEQKQQYGMTNLKEFVAEAYSNPQFQAALYSIKTGPNTSLWSRLVNAFLKATGLNKIIGTVKDDNLLGQTLSAADVLLSPPTSREGGSAAAPASDTILVGGVQRPTRNSNGQPIHPTEEGVRNFWRWFGDSKVVDSEGRPLVVYHGTGSDITVFDPSKTREAEVVFTTPDVDYANAFATKLTRNKNEQSNVLPLYVMISRPAYVKADYYQSESKFYALESGTTQADTDGMIVTKEDGSILIAAPFSGEQIKSATGNSGAFSPDNSSVVAAPASPEADQLQNDLSAIQGNRAPSISVPTESVGDKLRTVKASAREALIDYQTPIYNWLEGIFGKGKAITNPIWSSLKTIGTKRDALNTEFKNGTLRDINSVAKELSDKSGLHIEEAASMLGEYAKYVHIPEANATLQQRLQDAFNNADRDLKAADTDLQQAQQDFDAARTAVKTKQAPVANARAFSRAETALNEAGKARDAAAQRYDDAKNALNKFKTDPELAGGLTNQQAEQSKALLESKYDPALLQKGQQLLVKANRDALDASVSAGVIDKQTADRLKQAYPNYVPLFVDKDSLGVDPWSAMDGKPDLFSQGINASLLKEMQGYSNTSDVRSDNAYVNTVAKVAATNARIASQPFKTQLITLAQSKQAGPELRIKPLRGNNPDPRGMVATDRQGNQYQITFKSDQLADAIYSRGVEEFGTTGVPGMIASLGRLIARSVTQYTLAFAPINMVRDVGEKALLLRARKYEDANGQPVDGKQITNNIAKITATDFLSVMNSVRQAVSRDVPKNPSKYYDEIKEMLSEGGVSTWGDVFNKSRIEVLNEIKKLKGWRRVPTKVNDIVQHYNHMFDMFSSAVSYVAMKQAGMTPKAAAFATLDLMNFRNKGSRTGWLRALYLFANPALQSGANFVKHINTKQGKIDAVALGIAALGLYQLALMTGDDDELLGNEIDQRNSAEIERSMVFMVNGVPVKIPVPYGLAQLMWAFAVSGTRYARGVESGADALTSSVKSSLKSISPISPSEISATSNPLMFAVQTLTPSTVRPVIDVVTNTNAFGGPITRPHLNPKLPVSAQGKEGTEQFWKDVAQKLYKETGTDVAPEKLKTLWLGFTAGPIADATRALTFDKHEKGLSTSFRDDLRLLSFTGINRMIGGDSTALQSKYYEQIKAAEDAVKKYGLAEVDSNRRLAAAGKAVARKAILDKAPEMTDNVRKLVEAYYVERSKVTKAGKDKKKDLARAKTPDDIAEVNSKYEDATEDRMRDFLMRAR